jgi:hypothetical protein
MQRKVSDSPRVLRLIHASLLAPNRWPQKFNMGSDRQKISSF